MDLGRGLHSLSAFVSKKGRTNILKPKKNLKRHHNATAAAISQLDMKIIAHIIGIFLTI